jgi:hypothetical protein
MLAHEIDVLWAPTYPPSSNFWSSSSKAKPKAMWEIQDNTSVDPCSNLPKNQCGLNLRSLLTSWVFFMEFSPCLGLLKGGTFRPYLLLSLFLKSIGENMITMILWFLNIRHSNTLFLICDSSPRLNKCSFSSYPLNTKYVELMGKGK